MQKLPVEARESASDVCWRMLTYADVCWRMLTYADVCSAEAACGSARIRVVGARDAQVLSLLALLVQKYKV